MNEKKYSYNVINEIILNYEIKQKNKNDEKYIVILRLYSLLFLIGKLFS